MILGITGGTGCGKTTLLNLIRQRGGLVLDRGHRLWKDHIASLHCRLWRDDYGLRCHLP